MVRTRVSDFAETHRFCLKPSLEGKVLMQPLRTGATQSDLLHVALAHCAPTRAVFVTALGWVRL